MGVSEEHTRLRAEPAVGAMGGKWGVKVLGGRGIVGEGTHKVCWTAVRFGCFKGQGRARQGGEVSGVGA